MNRMRYLTNCVEVGMSELEHLQAMQDEGREVTLATGRRHCDPADFRAFERRMGYDTGGERGGLRLKDDWHVGYFKSTWKGRPCYYIVHSAIEHIWVPA